MVIKSPWRAKFGKSKEADILGAILDYLQATQTEHWRVPLSPVMRGGGKKKLRFSKNPMAGFPDIAGILPGGKFFTIEVKTLSGKLSDKQERWRDRLLNAGALYILATSVQDVKSSLGRI